jgi:hypothetical protein
MQAEPAATPADMPDAEYGTVAWLINSCLGLIGGHAFSYGDLKKAMLQAVIIIITANGAKHNEPLLFMRIMVSVCGCAWVCERVCGYGWVCAVSAVCVVWRV